MVRNIDQQNLIETACVIWSFEAMREKSHKSLKLDEELSTSPQSPQLAFVPVESISLSSLSILPLFN